MRVKQNSDGSFPNIKRPGQPEKKPLIILSGPTAVGKTGISVEFALREDLEIISADSAQVYRGMDIGTAKITPEEMKGVPHYLIDVCDPSEDYSAFRFKAMATDAIEEIRCHGKIPMVVGGTGFYIQALFRDINFDDEGPDAEYRKELESIADSKGALFLYDMLKKVDPESCRIIKPENVQRVIRALEYHHLTGGKISEHNAKMALKKSAYNEAYFVLTDDRDLMYERIDKRVDEMVGAGLEQEVRSLLDKGYNEENVSMQAIGYKEMIPYIRGEITLDEAVYQIKLRTRHFAKRQLTWYRREKNVIYIDKQIYRTGEEILDFMSSEIRKRGIK